MASGSKEVRRQLMKNYNISFDGPIDLTTNHRLPPSLEFVLRHIRKLGRTDFDYYREHVNADLLQHPWREQARRRARRIAGLAQLCLDGRKNESGWRLTLESEIMARFTVEVAWCATLLLLFLTPVSSGGVC
jgi:hypothetical protein